jgi:Uma2 family endonuclease
MAAIEEPKLHTGDRMMREEFHRLYEQTPEDFRAELIGGVVYVRGRVTLTHGTAIPPIAALLFHYEMATPGVECACHPTLLLGEDSEPEPDLLLRILTEHGGRSWVTDDDYLAGPPEAIWEVADDDRAIDLFAKRDDYARYGVLEYLVTCLAEKELRWFDMARGLELQPDADGVLRACSFPGLWIDVEVLWAHDLRRLLATLGKGLASPEHAKFVKRLASKRSSND